MMGANTVGVDKTKPRVAAIPVFLKVPNKTYKTFSLFFIFLFLKNEKIIVPKPKVKINIMIKIGNNEPKSERSFFK